MAFALIANAVGGTGFPQDSTTTSSINTTGANLIVIAVASYAVHAVPVIGDSKSNTWTNIINTASATIGRASLFYCLNPTVGAGHTFTSAMTGSYANLAVVAFSGAKATSVTDQSNGATTGAATALATGSITPSEDNELIVSSLCFNAVNTIAIDSGMTISNQFNYSNGVIFGIMCAYKIQTTAAAINPSASWGTSTAAEISIASFKAEPAASSSSRRNNLIGGMAC
jgi:hypothetical protein